MLIVNFMFFVLVMQLDCPIPLADDPNCVIIPKRRTDKIIHNLSYILEDNLVNNESQSHPLFGGHQSWIQRERSFNLNSTMKVNSTLY